MRSVSWALKLVSKDGLQFYTFLIVAWVIIGLFVLLLFSETAYAQFGGKSGAPSGIVVGDGYDISDKNTVVSENSGLKVSSATAGSAATTLNVGAKGNIGKLNYMTVSHMSANGKKPSFNRRQRYFVKKLRLEFAARETVEREAGIAASWKRVSFYLRELDNQLTSVEQSGKEVNAVFISGMARDLNLIESTLDDHIDQVLLPFEKSFLKPTTFFNMPLLPQSSAGLRAKMRALAEKSELVDFATKALQAMDPGPVN